jgi:hypothetical protein
MHEEREKKAMLAYPKLEAVANDLLAITDRILATKPTSSKHRHLEYMMFMFFYKQVTHMHSLLALKYSQDTALVARSMLEGWAMLQVARKNVRRAKQWRFFYTVSNWRRLKEADAAGNAVPEQTRKRVESDVKKYGPLYLTPEPDVATEPEKHAAWLDDPYHQNWRCNVKISRFFEILDMQAIYKRLYGRLAAWHHWDVDAVESVVTRKGTPTGILTTFWKESPARSCEALFSGIMALLASAATVDETYKTGQMAELAKIQDRVVAIRPGYDP